VVVGRSISLGKPIAMMLLNKNATVSITHSKTKDLYAYLSQADIVVACLGKPHFIEGSKLKEGAIVIDAGIHYLENGIIGDVKEDEKLLYISKVPGGVGIITTSVIMDNVYQCYKRKHQC
jgi:methylenetetrahydrofolate dehydrogenase (NADP+)/methenyltetrahydrofolate cyclohydrolase